jgi:hypothetical protein
MAVKGTLRTTTLNQSFRRCTCGTGFYYNHTEEDVDCPVCGLRFCRDNKVSPKTVDPNLKESREAIQSMRDTLDQISINIDNYIIVADKADDQKLDKIFEKITSGLTELDQFLKDYEDD